jgi:hypothetical protein
LILFAFVFFAGKRSSDPTEIVTVACPDVVLVYLDWNDELHLVDSEATKWFLVGGGYIVNRD